MEAYIKVSPQTTYEEFWAEVDHVKDEMFPFRVGDRIVIMVEADEEDA